MVVTSDLRRSATSTLSWFTSERQKRRAERPRLSGPRKVLRDEYVDMSKPLVRDDANLKCTSSGTKEENGRSFPKSEITIRRNVSIFFIIKAEIFETF